jgi:hypothetical protein
MLKDKRLILQAFIGLMLSLSVNDVFAQGDGRNQRQNPILVSIRASPFVLADLLGPDPEDTDAVIVDVKGVRHSFKLDEVRIRAQARMFDEFGKLGSNDEKARLDYFAVQLQNLPGSSAYVIVYGKCIGDGRTKSKKLKDYLVNTRGLENGRVKTLDNTCRNDFLIQLWIVPGGADPPTNSEATLERCPACPKPKKTRKRSRR